MHCKSYSHFFSKKFKHICVSLDVNFNESLTNDVVSFEQLGPDLLLHGLPICTYLRVNTIHMHVYVCMCIRVCMRVCMCVGEGVRKVERVCTITRRYFPSFLSIVCLAFLYFHFVFIHFIIFFFFFFSFLYFYYFCLLTSAVPN